MTPQLSRTEWNAVVVALNDAARCGCAGREPGGVGRLVEAITGRRRPRGLSDPRLETLRRFVCATRAGRPAHGLVPDLIAQGYSPAQVDALALLAA